MARTETTVDRFGRVLIPKELRQELGLDAGTRVHLQSRSEGLLLVPDVGDTPLREIDGVLVFTGKLVGDAAKVLDEVRSERLRQVGGLG